MFIHSHRQFTLIADSSVSFSGHTTSRQSLGLGCSIWWILWIPVQHRRGNEFRGLHLGDPRSSLQKITNFRRPHADIPRNRLSVRNRSLVLVSGRIRRCAGHRGRVDFTGRIPWGHGVPTSVERSCAFLVMAYGLMTRIEYPCLTLSGRDLRTTAGNR